MTFNRVQMYIFFQHDRFMKPPKRTLQTNNMEDLTSKTIIKLFIIHFTANILWIFNFIVLIEVALWCYLHHIWICNFFPFAYIMTILHLHKRLQNSEESVLCGLIDLAKIKGFWEPTFQIIWKEKVTCNA